MIAVSARRVRSEGIYGIALDRGSQVLRDADILEQIQTRVRCQFDYDIDVGAWCCLTTCDRTKQAGVQNTTQAKFRLMGAQHGDGLSTIIGSS